MKTLNLTRRHAGKPGAVERAAKALATRGSRSKPNAKSILKALIKTVGPTEQWKGNCFALATQVVRRGIVEGDAVYGMWHGPIAEGSFFEERHGSLPFTQHGWVNLHDGRICDPTRWVFENVEPYIYVGPNDHYDEGANRLRQHQPPPQFDPSERTVTIAQHILSGSAWTHIESLLGMDQHLSEDVDYEPGTVTIEQIFWVANRAPDVLFPHTVAIYEAIDKLGYGAAVPYDNREASKRLRLRRVDP